MRDDDYQIFGIDCPKKYYCSECENETIPYDVFRFTCLRINMNLILNQLNILIGNIDRDVL